MVIGSALRDDALTLERGDFLGRVAGQRPQYLLGMLAEQRRAPCRHWRVRQPERADDRREAAARWMIEIDDRAALAQMRILEHFGRVEHRAAPHAAPGKRLHDIVLVARAGPAFEHLAQR